MPMDVLHEIRQTELKADEIIREAGVRSKEAVALARRKADQLLDDAAREAKKRAEDIAAAAVEEAGREVEAINVQLQGECSQIRNSAEGRIEGAADLIVERIVKTCGNC